MKPSTVQQWRSVRALSHNKGKEEGAAMIIVMLMLLASTALGLFGIHATSFEIRAAGNARQAMQAEHLSETALSSTMALVDYLGPQSLVQALRTATPPAMYAPEPALAAGKTAYRVYLDDFPVYFGAGGTPADHNSLGPKNAYTPTFAVDIYDNFTFTGTLPGHRSDGNTQLQYLHATYTARGRTQVLAGDVSVGTDIRYYNEGAADSRAHGISGPFAP